MRRAPVVGQGGPSLATAADARIARLRTSPGRSEQPSLFICEGLLTYLDAPTCHRLLAALGDRAASGSVLAASLSAHADGADSAIVVAEATAGGVGAQDCPTTRNGACSTSWPSRNDSLPQPLTGRELEVLRLVAAGRSNQRIAHDLVVALDTVLRRVTHVLGKLGAANAPRLSHGLGARPDP